MYNWYQRRGIGMYFTSMSESTRKIPNNQCMPWHGLAHRHFSLYLKATVWRPQSPFISTFESSMNSALEHCQTARAIGKGSWS